MKNIKNYNDYLNERKFNKIGPASDIEIDTDDKKEFMCYEGGGQKWPGYTEEEKKGNFVVAILTQDVLDRFKERYPGKPRSIKHMSHHMSPVPYEQAVKDKKEWETKGTYKGQTISSVTLFKQSVIEQGD